MRTPHVRDSSRCCWTRLLVYSWWRYDKSDTWRPWVTVTLTPEAKNQYRLCPCLCLTDWVAPCRLLRHPHASRCHTRSKLTSHLPSQARRLTQPQCAYLGCPSCLRRHGTSSCRCRCCYCCCCCGRCRTCQHPYVGSAQRVRGANPMMRNYVCTLVAERHPDPSIRLFAPIRMASGRLLRAVPRPLPCKRSASCTEERLGFPNAGSLGIVSVVVLF